MDLNSNLTLLPLSYSCCKRVVKNDKHSQSANEVVENGIYSEFIQKRTKIKAHYFHLQFFKAQGANEPYFSK